MTTDDAKKVLEMLSEGKDEIPKETVFEIIDMIKAEGSVVSVPWTYPTTAPSTELYPKVTRMRLLVPMQGGQYEFKR